MHRDIKPENLLLGKPDGSSESLIHVVDFGLAAQYCDMASHVHIAYKRQTYITGTVRYLSINGHTGIELTRRDDLESLAYVFIYFLRGSLPWQGINVKSRKKKSALVMKKKISTTTQDLCRNLPRVFATFLDYARHLPFDAAPDYNYLRTLFCRTLDLAGYIKDDNFDWSARTHMPGSLTQTRPSSSNTVQSRGPSCS